MLTPYDEVLYPGLPYSQTHPDRLASLAILFGLEPAPIESCRVLEVGCAGGGNLIPIAFEFPASEFVGIDLAATAIRAGKEEIAALGLTNIRLEDRDIQAIGHELGTFDYIIAHGFYSWVPEPVRDRLFSLVKAGLAPQGVAYVSYNALPGCHIRGMLREMMQFHVRDRADSKARLDGGREILEWFTQSHVGAGMSRGFLRDEAQLMLERAPNVLYHDELGDVYHPVYFEQFMAHAARFGLQYLSEANYFDTQAGKIPEAIVQKIDRSTGGNRILREQYFDLLKCRMFRQTLLCHAEAPVSAKPLQNRVCRLSPASAAAPVSTRPDFQPGVAEEFTSARGAAAKTAHPLAKATLFLLGDAWPEAVRFPDLLAAAAQLARETP